jgi:hypothetical protein
VGLSFARPGHLAASFSSELLEGDANGGCGSLG